MDRMETQAEHELHKLIRALLAISKCKQAMLHAHDELEPQIITQHFNCYCFFFN